MLGNAAVDESETYCEHFYRLDFRIPQYWSFDSTETAPLSLLAYEWSGGDCSTVSESPLTLDLDTSYTTEDIGDCGWQVIHQYSGADGVFFLIETNSATQLVVALLSLLSLI